jgi:hypothetical protein
MSFSRGDGSCFSNTSNLCIFDFFLIAQLARFLVWLYFTTKIKMFTCFDYNRCGFRFTVLIKTNTVIHPVPVANACQYVLL